MAFKDLPLESATGFAASLSSASSLLQSQGHPVETQPSAIAQRFLKYETIIFDIDGVIQIGSAPLAGVGAAIAFLRRHGKRLLFLTNTAGKSRHSCSRLLTEAGIPANEGDVVTMAYAAASYLKEELPEARVIFAVGSQALRQECEAQGLEVVFADEEEKTIAEETASTTSQVGASVGSSVFRGVIRNTDDFARYSKTRLRSDVSAVLLGYDQRFSFHKLCVACLYAQLKPPSRMDKSKATSSSPPEASLDETCVPLIATNKDVFNRVAGFRQPTNGAMVASVETALGRQAKCIGKESSWLPSWMRRRFNFDPKSTLVVGDRLDTDMVFARNVEADFCLVMTGCSTPTLLLERGADTSPKPTFIVAHLGLLAEAELSSSSFLSSSSSSSFLSS